MAKLSRDEFLKKVRKSGDLMMFHQEFNDDYEMGLAAVSNWGQAIRFLTYRLRDDETIVALSARDDPMGTNLCFASDRLKDNGSLVSIFLKKGNGNAYQYASDRLKDDKELVELALSNGGSLYFASDRLKDDEDFVSLAVGINGNNLVDASERLRDNENIVYKAALQDGNSIQYASDRLRDNEKIVEASIINGSGLNIYYASDRLKHNPRLGLLAVQYPPVRNLDNLNCPLKELPEELRDNDAIVNESVLITPHSLFYASDRLKDTYETVSIAYNGDNKTIQYASERMQLDQSFTMQWLEQVLDKNNETDVFKKIILTEFNELYAARGYIPSNESKIPKLILTNKNKKTEE